jgi:hypothetical protein
LAHASARRFDGIGIGGSTAWVSVADREQSELVAALALCLRCSVDDRPCCGVLRCICHRFPSGSRALVHLPPISGRGFLSSFALGGRVRAVGFGRRHYIYPRSARHEQHRQICRSRLCRPGLGLTSLLMRDVIAANLAAIRGPDAGRFKELADQEPSIASPVLVSVTYGTGV